MDHAFYVYSSYGFTAVLVIAVIVLTWTDGRLRRRELKALEASGLRRRSQRKLESEAQ